MEVWEEDTIYKILGDIDIQDNKEWRVKIFKFSLKKMLLFEVGISNIIILKLFLFIIIKMQEVFVIL